VRVSEQVIAPDELTRWAPAEVTVRSPEGWDGVAVRGYRYAASDVDLPAVRDHLVVAYRRGRTTMNRRTAGKWRSEPVGPGDVSLISQASASTWYWRDAVEVVHVYLAPEELASTCRQMYEREVHEVELHHHIKTKDPALHHTAMQMAHEAAHGSTGCSLMVESLSCQLAVHILRRHAHVRFAEQGGTGGLTPSQERAVREFVGENLSESLSLSDLASVVGLSRFHFARRFRVAVGTSPHDFVMKQRVERARTMLERTDSPLLEVASSCGFSDQSHMTREFKKRTGVTPGRYRAECR
jgi:AraC family transcriptional regulator